MTIKPADVWSVGNRSVQDLMRECGLVVAEPVRLRGMSLADLHDKVVAGERVPWFVLAHCEAAIEPIPNRRPQGRTSRDRFTGFGLYTFDVLTHARASAARERIKAIVGSLSNAEARLREQLGLEPDRVPLWPTPGSQDLKHVHVAAAGLRLYQARYAASCTFIPNRLPGDEAPAEPITIKVVRVDFLPLNGN